MKRYRSFIFITVIIVMLSTLSTLVSPVMVQVWSRSEGGLSASRIAMLCGILLISGLLEILCFWLREHFAKNFNIANCKAFLGLFWGMEYDKINEAGSLSLTAKIRQAVNDFYMYYVNGKINLIVSTIILGVILCLAFFYNNLIFWILLSLALVNILGYKALNKELLVRSKKLQEDTSSGWQEINQIISNTDYIKQLHTEKYLFEQMEPSIQKIYTSMKNINLFAQTVSHSIMVFNNLCETFIMMFLGFRFFQNSENAYSLVLYTVLLPLFSAHLNKVVNVNLDKRNLLVSKDFIHEMEQSRERCGKEQIREISKIRFDFPEWENGFVHFQPIEEEFTKGDIVQVKGKSGCGKSTLMKFLPQFWKTHHIQLNGCSLEEIDLQACRRLVNYVPQQSPIIKGTLRDNLFLGRPYSSQAEQQMAACPVLESIFRSKNMDSQITENGGNLSGGERQKIAFAREIFSEADVFIFDEITSNIDIETAREIYQAIQNFHNDKIIFIISHDSIAETICNRQIILS